MGERERATEGGQREEEGRPFFQPGGNPPDPPLQAWLAGGEEALGPACTSGLGRSCGKPGSGKPNQ